MKTIQILIDSQGQIRLQTEGFAGASCKEASKALEQALGLVQADQPTAELYQSAQHHETARHNVNGGGGVCQNSI